MKPIRYLVWPLRSLKVRNPFLTLTWPGDLTFGDLGLKLLHKVSNSIARRYWKNGGAARRCFFAIREKPEGWAFFAPSSARVNPRPAGGGGGVNAPPRSGFLRMAKIAPPGFHPPYPPSFPQLLWKRRPKAMWGQVTRSGQVTQLQNNFPIAPRLQCFRENYETFGIW